jgi:eukaryotic-like serine/threonine-protein kinase
LSFGWGPESLLRGLTAAVPPAQLSKGHSPQFPFSWSRDGKRVAFTQASSGTGPDIWTLPLKLDNTGAFEAGDPEPFLQGSTTEWSSAFSPDGRWIAYTSSESGSLDVHVRPFPSGDRRWQVSSRGGGSPVWSATRPELYYRSAENTLMAVSYTVNGETFVP